MVTFGFSAFLKLLSMNERPQKTELKRRAGPSTGGGYDFHSSFRRLARRLLVDGGSLADVLAAAGTITKEAERLSATAALERLAEWRGKTPGAIFACEPVTFESPGKLYRVKFEPDFGLVLGGKRTAFHLWNTQRPPLASGPTYAALTWAKEAYDGRADAPDDVAVLSTRPPTTAYLLGTVSVPPATLSAIVRQVEDAIRGGGAPPPAPPEIRPPTP